jgi:glyoxylase-like metal-dependent hydrolase (beta-lactamase superfamily II)
MDLSHTQFGPFKLYTIETGRFRLDGGAMFGVVPKTLWSRYIDVDDKNRMLLAMRCLLIESQQTDRIYLIDNGAGTKFNDKMASIYDFNYDHSDLISSLACHGFSPDDVTDIIFTHLHFDHCGGSTFYDEDGNIAHTFQHAAYHITKKHWQTATEPNAREKASFLPDNIDPLAHSSRLHLVEERHQFEEGLSMLPAEGHTMGQQIPKIDTGERTLIFAADLLPTHVHLPLPWVMGYDMRPLQTLKEKSAFLDEAIEKNWYLFLEHDPDKEVICVGRKEGKYAVGSTLRLNEVTE